MSIWYMEVFEGMTADCPTFFELRHFPKYHVHSSKKPERRWCLMWHDVIGWNVTKQYILRHHTWSLVRSTRRCGFWDYYYFKSPMVQWSNGFLHQDPLDEIKPKCLSSCQDWLFAPQVRQCKNQSRVCYIFMNRSYKLLRLKTKRFKKAIKGGLYQEFEVMLSISSAIDCSVCRFYHSNSSEGRVQQLRDPHLHAHGWQRQERKRKPLFLTNLENRKPSHCKHLFFPLALGGFQQLPMGIFSVVSNGLIGDCRGQFEELTMCQDQWNNLKVSFSYIITVEHDTWKWSPRIFRFGQLVPLENRWQDHCVAHEIFHHVKWQWRRHWFGKTEGQEQNYGPMDLESSLLFVNFNVVHFRDLIVFRIPVWLEDPFASEAISGLQIAFIHTGGTNKTYTRELRSGSQLSAGRIPYTPWPNTLALKAELSSFFLNWWVIPGNTAMMSMDAVSRVVVPLWFAGRERKVPVIIQTDGSQSCSWVFQFLFSDSQMHSYELDTSAANMTNSSKYLDKLLSQVVNCWEGFECCILSENPVGRIPVQ